MAIKERTLIIYSKHFDTLNKRQVTYKTGENEMKEPRIIKRYQNRKLYDTYQSCYVTLEEIAQIVREGNEIQVIDNKSKNDITYMTQIQLLFDQERKSTKGGDTELLKRVIRAEEGTLTGYIRALEAKVGTVDGRPVVQPQTVAQVESTLN